MFEFAWHIFYKKMYQKKYVYKKIIKLIKPIVGICVQMLTIWDLLAETQLLTLYYV